MATGQQGGLVVKNSALCAIFLGTAMAVLAVGTAKAEVIPVANGNFQIANPFTPPGENGFESNTGSVPDWTLSSTSAGGGGQMVVTPGATFDPLPGFPEGTILAWLNRGTLTQTVAGTSVVSGDTYTFTADLVERTDETFDAWAALVIGGNTYLATGIPPAPGYGSTYSVTFVGTPSTAGDPIEIELGTTGIQGDFGPVSLSGPASPSAVPESGALGRLLISFLALLGMAGFARKHGLAS
jgi:hypothetical protein